jgi:hypothetical protein
MHIEKKLNEAFFWDNLSVLLVVMTKICVHNRY